MGYASWPIRFGWKGGAAETRSAVPGETRHCTVVQERLNFINRADDIDQTPEAAVTILGVRIDPTGFTKMFQPDMALFLGPAEEKVGGRQIGSGVGVRKIHGHGLARVNQIEV